MYILILGCVGHLQLCMNLEPVGMSLPVWQTVCCRCTALRGGNTASAGCSFSVGSWCTLTVVVWLVGAAGESELQDTLAQGLRVFGRGKSCSSPKAEQSSATSSS